MPSDDGIIRIGTQVDISNLRTGMAEAQAAVKTAAANMAEAQAAFGKAAEAGSQEAAAALQLYRTELASAQSAVAALANTESQETQVLKSTISARMAASSELRVLEGNMMGSTRAAGAFLSTLPGIGRAMLAAFPVFGAVALIGIIGQATEAVGRLITAFRNLSGVENLAAEDAIIAGDKIARATADKLTLDNLARLSVGAPANKDINLPQAGAKLKEIQYAHELADAQAAVNEQGKTGVALQRQKILDAQKDVEYARQASAEAQKLVQSYRDMLAAKITVTSGQAARKWNTPEQTQVAAITDPKQVSAIEQQTRTAEQAVEEFNHQLDLAKVKLEGAQLKLPSVETKGDNQEAQKKLRDFETAFQQERASQAQNIFAERNYWQSKLSAFQAGSSEYLSVLSKVAELTIEVHKQETEAIAKYSEMQKRDGEEATRSLEEISRVTSEIQGKQAADILRSSDAWDGYQAAVTKGSEIQDQNKASIEQATISFDLATDRMSKLGAAHALAAIHAADYTAKLKELKAELDELKGNAKIDPITGQNTDAGNAKAQQDVQNQISQMQGQSAVSAISDQAAIQQQIVQPWLNAFQQINQGWLQVQNKMFYSTRNIGLDFAKMGQQIFISIVDNLEKAALIAAERELMMLITHQVANNAKVASDAQAAAQSNAISAMSSMKQITHAAATAAAKAYQAMAGIPVVGPILGAIAAATVFAAVEAFGAMASFDTGTGYVPSDGIAYLHEGEAVIPAPTMEDLRGSSGGGDVTINQHNNWNSMTDREFRRQIDRHASSIAGAVRKHLRQGGKG